MATPNVTLDGMGAGSPEEIVQAVAASRAKARFRFRTLFVLTWLILVGGLVLAILSTGRIDGGFLQEWGPYILLGVPLTIVVSVLSIIFATLFAVIGALGRLSRTAPIYAVATLYVSLVRGTPLIVQVFFIYSALPQFGPRFVLAAFPSAVLALSLNYGAYMSEIFRAGIQAVGRGQIEAAYALGMTPWQTMRRIILPQALRIITPDIGNQFIAMQKDYLAGQRDHAAGADGAGAPGRRAAPALLRGAGGGGDLVLADDDRALVFPAQARTSDGPQRPLAQ